MNAINHIVLKINDVMKNRGLSMGLFRDNTRRKNRHKREKKQCVWFYRQNAKRKGFFRAKNQHMRLKVHTPLKFEHSVSIKKKVNRQLRNIVQELCESRGGRPGLSVLTSLLVSVDVKIY